MDALRWGMRWRSSGWRKLNTARATLWSMQWLSISKCGAAGAVGLGVKRGIFSPLALAVASFDALSGLLALHYWSTLRD